MLPKSINTLEEVYARQAKLQQQMEFTRQAFFGSASQTGDSAKDFFLKKVALPAGAIGLGYLAGKHLLAHSKKREDPAMEERYDDPVPVLSTSRGWFLSLLSIGIPLVQQFLLRGQMNREVEEKTEAAYAYREDDVEKEHKYGGAIALNWFIKLLPFVIPLLQKRFANSHAPVSENGNGTHSVHLHNGHGSIEEVHPQSRAATFAEWALRLLPIIIPLVQQHFMHREIDRKVEERM